MLIRFTFKIWLYGQIRRIGIGFANDMIRDGIQLKVAIGSLARAQIGLQLSIQ